MEKAKQHVHDALRYKGPRFDILNSNEPKFYKTVYQVQTSTLWELIMGIFSFAYMYMIVFESTEFNSFYHVGSPVIYCIFILDFIMQTYHQSYDETSHKSRFSTLFLVKVLTLVLVGVDEVLIGLNVQAGARPIHPFRIMRVGKANSIQFCQSFTTAKSDDLSNLLVQRIKTSSFTSYSTPWS